VIVEAIDFEMRFLVTLKQSFFLKPLCMPNTNLLCAFMCVAITNSIVSYSQNDFCSSMNTSSHSETFVEQGDVEWVENIDLRTIFSSTWNDGSGRMRLEYSKSPINYLDEKRAMQRIISYPHLEGDLWIANQQPFTISLSEVGVVHTAMNSHLNAVAVSTERIGSFSATGSVEGKDVSEGLVVKNIIPGIDKEFFFQFNAVKSQYRLHDIPDLVNGDFIIEDELTIPHGAIIRRDEQHGYESDGWWYGNMEVLGASGEVISFIQGTWCMDMAHDVCTAGYRWKQIGERQIKLETKVSSEWLLGASYPVLIDPLVTGPTAAWGDIYMPSCFIPEYHTDSMLVTVPGGITITGFFITASFYADPFTTAVMEDGSMRFSTSCATSQTFEVQPPNGELPGTAYLESFDLRNPLLCCYDPSCSETSFYLTMELGRYTPGDDCNETYIYYDPFTLWPFTAFIEGHTVEAYGPQWTVEGNDICSNKCDFEGTARIRYGVPPYTLTHPWMEGSIVVEEPTPCDLGNTLVDMILEWPGCPQYCPEPFGIDVPPPLVTDACGNTIAGMPTDDISIKPAPSIEDPSPVEVCSGADETLVFESCAPSTEITWTGNGGSGQGPVPLNIVNQSGNTQSFDYFAFVVWNGCASDTIAFDLEVFPEPDASFYFQPNPVIQNVPAEFDANGSSSVDPIISWLWTIDGLQPQFGSGTSYIFSELIEFEVCLEVASINDCSAIECQDVMVVSADIAAPNIFTPNLDGLNDALVFPNLDFFPTNRLSVWNRWGNLVFERENYNNSWDGGDLPGGTYYYILDVEYIGEQSGYVMIQR